MTKEQFKKYKLVEEKEQLKITNFSMLPKNINQVNSIIDHLYKDDLHKWSPKLIELLTIILSKSDEKHLIFTRYDKHYGLHILEKFLNHLDIKNVKISITSNNSLNISNINLFNNLYTSNTVIITSMIPPIDIKNIGNIHFFEGVCYEVFMGILKRTFKQILLNEPISSFNVYFHLSENSLDITYYNELLQYIKTNLDLYNTIYQKTKYIQYNHQNGLSVEE